MNNGMLSKAPWRFKSFKPETYDWFKMKFGFSESFWIIKQSDKTKEYVTENSNKCWHRTQGSLSLYFQQAHDVVSTLLTSKTTLYLCQNDVVWLLWVIIKHCLCQMCFVITIITSWLSKQASVWLFVQ